MAVVRTVLPRKGIIQPKHGDNYEADLDQNWLTLDNLLQDATDVSNAVAAAGTFKTFLEDLSLNGVVSGFTLSTSATLTPGLTAGVLYAQGNRYVPGSAPNPGAAPASSTRYLFYNSTTGFYYQSGAVGATAGDALIGKVTTNSTAVIAITPATPLNGQLAVGASAPGNFTAPHYLGRTPQDVRLIPTSGSGIWFQSGTPWDGTNLYLVAAAAGATAIAILS